MSIASTTRGGDIFGVPHNTTGLHGVGFGVQTCKESKPNVAVVKLVAVSTIRRRRPWRLPCAAQVERRDVGRRRKWEEELRRELRRERRTL